MDLVVLQVVVEAGPAVDLDGEVPRGVVDRHQAGQVVKGEPVLEVALAGVARPRVRQPDRLAVPEGLEDLPVPFLLQGAGHLPPRHPLWTLRPRPETSATKRGTL